MTRDEKFELWLCLKIRNEVKHAKQANAFGSKSTHIPEIAIRQLRLSNEHMDRANAFAEALKAFRLSR